MKKVTSIIALIFAFVMIMALPISASAPYQTYTYSISGTALYSPDAYTPTKSIDSAYMGLTDIIVIAIIILIVGGAIAYIVKAKKHGQKCIGCPDSKNCSGNCSSCCDRDGNKK